MKFLSSEQAKILANILSNFRYCPLISMFCGKASDSLDVKTHYRMIRAIYDTDKIIY